MNKEESPITTRRILQVDVDAVFRQVMALAEYEKLLPSFTGSPEALAQHLFQEDAFVEGVIGEQDSYPAGISLFYCRYDPMQTRPIFFVEDFFVESYYRRKGIGTAMLSYLAQLALGRSCTRMEWMVLQWNTPALSFYQKFQVQILEHDRVARISGDALRYLGTQTLPPVLLRDGEPADLSALWELLEIKGNVKGSIDKLEEHLFGFIPYVRVLVAEHAGRPIGMALYSRTYSSFATAPGIFLEELFVLPEYRGYGLGKSFLISLAQRTLAIGGVRLDFYIDSSQPKVVNYYQKLGAEILHEWRICRVDSTNIQKLAIL
ncbi:MAG: hypothetical protein CV045_00075 [Cyanobacteria bacterium M5B4]|nr:MAG: hypothetical protein CV045_00075 [Cyanobacteria bacterium M5B4]